MYPPGAPGVFDPATAMALLSQMQMLQQAATGAPGAAAGSVGGGVGDGAPGFAASATVPPWQQQTPQTAPLILGAGDGVDPNEELRTVFVVGFPPDLRDRELQNLLRFLPGYQASQLNHRNGQTQGFAMFQSHTLARRACERVHGLLFDEGVALRAEMARKNMYVPHGPGSEGGAAAGGPMLGQKRPRPGAGGAPWQGPADGFAAGAGMQQGPGALGLGSGVPARGYAPVSNTKDNPPCNTLFVGNLSESVSEDELLALFSPQPGFVQLKMHRARNLSCFVEFDSVEAAVLCHDSQQGAVLASSSKGPIRIQYSKNPLGKRQRDSQPGSTGGQGPPGQGPPGQGPPGQGPPIQGPPGQGQAAATQGGLGAAQVQGFPGQQEYEPTAQG